MAAHRLHVDGALAFGRRFRDASLRDATGVGVIAPGASGDARLRALEAHPRAVPIPEALRLGEVATPSGVETLLEDRFGGPPGDLLGRRSGDGAAAWERTIGSGAIDLTGADAARVRGGVASPNPGRTAYTLRWERPELADLEVEITPPGAARGEGENGRGGVIFWQDDDNYVIVSNWLDDVYDGASLSAFFRLGGFEEVFDAVWSNVGDRIRWGRPHTLRVAFDGMRFVAHVDGEPLLYRALSDIYPDATPLAIRRVGIVANWEWGDDTGSVFRRFTARG